MASLTLRFAARDNWDEVIAASVQPNTTGSAKSLNAVEDASGWARVGRRAVHPFEDPGVLLMQLLVSATEPEPEPAAAQQDGPQHPSWRQEDHRVCYSSCAAVSEAFLHLEDKITLANFLDANGLRSMSPATQIIPFHAEAPVPRPAWPLPWVLKRDGTSGGMDVHFVTDPSVVDEWVVTEQELAEQLPFHSERTYIPGWVLQQNIERPLLLQGRKFHLRAYALVIQRAATATTSALPGGSTDAVDAPPTVYLYDKYDVRLAGALYSEDYGDHAAHVTNGNKDPAAVRLVIGADGRSGDAQGEAEEAEEGGRLWKLVQVGVLPQLQSWLANIFAPGLVIPPPPKGPPPSESESDSDSDSGLPNGTDRGSSELHCWTRFSLLGADIMVDELGTPWLLEFNHNPALPPLDLSAGSDPDGAGERVGGAFARHIAAMVSAALPLLLCGNRCQHGEAITAAVARTIACGVNKAGVGGRWNHVHGP